MAGQACPVLASPAPLPHLPAGPVALGPSGLPRRREEPATWRPGWARSPRRGCTGGASTGRARRLSRPGRWPGAGRGGWATMAGRLRLQAFPRTPCAALPTAEAGARARGQRRDRRPVGELHFMPCAISAPQQGAEDGALQLSVRATPLLQRGSLCG